MVSIDISIEDISRLLGRDKPLTPTELNELLAYAIAEVDSDPEGPDENGHTKITIDIKTSNRPDLWGVEGIVRVLRGMMDQPGLPPLDADPSGFEIDVNPELKEIRPYIGAAVVRNLNLDDFLIKQIIQLQDKVDFSFGRKRKRTSIGVYNVSMLKSPIEYTVVDRNFKFQPLQFDEKLTIDQIFEQHPKGIEYRHILDPFERVPMLYDVNKLVLSMPPVINSDDVGRVTEETSDVLVEVTGMTHEAVNVALLVIVQALRDRGGKVESVVINYPDNYDISSEISPPSEPGEIVVNPKDINKYLGTKFAKKKIIDLITTRRHNSSIDQEMIKVKYPPWRSDILHWVDISEEVAIAAGYNKFVPTDVQVTTPGKLDPSTEGENLVREVLIGLGIVETLNYVLIDKESITTNINREQIWIDTNCVEVANPVSRNRLIIRPELLPGLIRFTSRNTHVEYPQRIFETGECVIKVNDQISTHTNAAILLASKNETFETIQGCLDSLMRLLSLDYQLTALQSHYYLNGRSAVIICDGIEIGHLGELSPIILENYGIEMPVSALEIDLSKIPWLNCREIKTDEIPIAYI
ncbi:MAG: phenylalanine--tRNA ligase subunit beta [Candidatus Kariarchaeaceae archaeon]|jgi:phenylalanyl-tRNA synthetase beta chain